MTLRLWRLQAVRGPALALLTALTLGLGPGDAVASDDFADMPHLSAAINRALEYERDGTSVQWSNAETGNAGAITVESTFFRDPETPCRTYRRTTQRADGSAGEIFGTGCREPRGVWRLTEEPLEEAEKQKAEESAGSKTATQSPRADPDTGEPTSVFLSDTPASASEGDQAADVPAPSEGADRPEAAGGEADTAWMPPVPRPKPQIARIVTSMPTQSDE